MQQYRHERGSRQRLLFRNNSYATIAFWYKTPHSTRIRNNTTADRKGVFDYRFYFYAATLFLFIFSEFETKIYPLSPVSAIFRGEFSFSAPLHFWRLLLFYFVCVKSTGATFGLRVVFVRKEYDNNI